MNHGGSGESCYYSILEIHKDASFSEIRSAYRKLALRWHPDRWAKKPSVAEEAKYRFQKIQEAYSVLSDEGKRSLYDAGFLDLLEDGDEGMEYFLRELMNMMEQNAGKQAKEEETVEDLQRMFIDMFGGDLAKMMQDDDDDDDDVDDHPPVKRRAHDCGSTARAGSKRGGSGNTSL